MKTLKAIRQLVRDTLRRFVLTSPYPWDELIGRDDVRCVFNLDPCKWPIPGYPAWIVIEAVDMPLMLIRSKWSREKIWINASIIETISYQQNVRAQARPTAVLYTFAARKGYRIAAACGS